MGEASAKEISENRSAKQTMSLAEKIQTDLVGAMRAKDELRLSVLRGIKSAIALKERAGEKIRALDEAETIQILQTLMKQRKESIEQFTKGNRPELAAKETKELAIIESYLPAGASDAEMDAAIAKAISETGANSMKQMGAVVKAAKAALQGKTVDGKVLSDRVRDRLSKLG
ncbi:MAG TPA: GatB/YqeY domain-containing protein [Candidatus Acidoferrum sp.]|nr:GatB/YqeY domain-containing protein [Candidatus Acidoferrum sp.]